MSFSEKTEKKAAFRYGISAGLEDLPQRQPVTLRGDIESVCKQAKAIGYDAVELHVREPRRYDPAAIRKTARAHDLEICAVANGMEYTVGGLCLVDPDGEARKKAADRFREHIDFCAELKALCISGIMRGNIPAAANRDDAFSLFRDVTQSLCEYAAGKNVVIVLEAINRYINNYLNSVPETMDWIVSTGISNLRLHMDTHSMAIEEKNLVASVLHCRNKPLGYVHYSDNNRLYPGGGALDFKSLTQALVDIGYRGYITQESAALPDSFESARRGFEYMKSIERIVRIENVALGNA